MNKGENKKMMTIEREREREREMDIKNTES